MKYKRWDYLDHMVQTCVVVNRVPPIYEFLKKKQNVQDNNF